VVALGPPTLMDSTQDTAWNVELFSDDSRPGSRDASCLGPSPPGSTSRPCSSGIDRSTGVMVAPGLLTSKG